MVRVDVLGSIAVVFMSCKVKISVADFNVSTRYIFADQVFFTSYVLRHILLLCVVVEGSTNVYLQSG